MPRRIDVHQHIVPPDYARWLQARGAAADAGRALPAWSTARALEVMDANGIESALLSVSTPGVTPAAGDEAASIARTLNEYSAGVAREHPRRFGWFATLPLPDVDRAAAEAAHALDTLGAQGVTLLANSNGVYIGGPADEPLMAELDRREAVAFVHPSVLPGASVEGIPPFAADFLLDTSRAAYNLVRHGVIARYPNIKFILSHAGGMVPYAAHRMALPIAAEARRPIEDVVGDFQSFWFDTALSASPAALPSLMAFAKPGRVLFGSDWPFAPSAIVSYFARHLDAWEGVTYSERHAIDRDNALLLFPRFA